MLHYCAVCRGLREATLLVLRVAGLETGCMEEFTCRAVFVICQHRSDLGSEQNKAEAAAARGAGPELILQGHMWKADHSCICTS